jgi:hypothetical protein
MRKSQMHFVTHFSELLFLRNRGSSAPTGLSRVVFDVIPDRVISSLEPSSARSETSFVKLFFKIPLCTEKLTVKRFDIVFAVPVVEFCWVTDYVLDGGVCRWPFLLRDDRHDISEKPSVLKTIPFLRRTGCSQLIFEAGRLTAHTNLKN